MKIKIIFILTALAFSCGRFSESSMSTGPQPDKETELKEIPRKLIGTYTSLTDSVDSTERKNLEDTIYREGNDSMTVRVTTDSLLQRSVHFDTLYYPSDNFVIK